MKCNFKGRYGSPLVPFRYFGFFKWKLPEWFRLSLYDHWYSAAKGQALKLRQILALPQAIMPVRNPKS